MFVIKLKDIINNIVKIIILLIAFIIFFIFAKKVEFKRIFPFNINVLNRTVLISDYKENISNAKYRGKNKLLLSKLAIFSLEKEGETIKKEEVSEEKNIIKEATNITKVSILPQIETHVIEENNIPDNYTNIYNTVKIKNESDYKLTEEILNDNYDLSNKNDIIIYHTHTCESYTPTSENYYSQTGNYRTTNSNYSVVRVGSELEKDLSLLGFNVLHDKTYHDYPAYTGSYTRGLSTISKILLQSNAEFIIDLHRDAIRKFKFLCSNSTNWR